MISETQFLIIVTNQCYPKIRKNQIGIRFTSIPDGFLVLIGMVHDIRIQHMGERNLSENYSAQAFAYLLLLKARS